MIAALFLFLLSPALANEAVIAEFLQKNLPPPPEIFPIGLGVGNAGDDTFGAIFSAVSDPDAWGGPLVIDTAHASRNERDISRAIKKGREARANRPQVGTAQHDAIATVRCGTVSGFVKLETSSFTVELRRALSPLGFDRALALFTQGYYDASPLFRVIKGFLVQFGIAYPRGGASKELRDFADTTINDDPKRNGPSGKFVEGTVAFAGSGVHSRTSQLFVSYHENPNLGGSPWETPIGKVVEGMDTLKKLYSGYGEKVDQNSIRIAGINNEKNDVKKEFPLMHHITKCEVLEHKHVETTREPEKRTGLRRKSKKQKKNTIEPVPETHDSNDSVTVITKVWYTHLGYNRTVASVEESLRELADGEEDTSGAPLLPNRTKVIVLIHWPRCPEDFEWTDCAGEEASLDLSVKNLGPSPLAWTESSGDTAPFISSYMALEDLFVAKKIHGIGVSNFGVEEMEGLLAASRIVPHVYQGNIWQYFANIPLMKMIHDHGVPFMAYNVMNGIIGNKDVAPIAYAELEGVGKEIGAEAIRGLEGSELLNDLLGEGNEDMAKELAQIYDPSSLLLSWLNKGGVLVVPRASNPRHRLLNSPKVVFSIPNMVELAGGLFAKRINRAAQALLMKEDIDPAKEMQQNSVMATFINTVEEAIKVFWVNKETGEEHEASEEIEPGKAAILHTHPGHEFVTRDMDGNVVGRELYTVNAAYGESEEFHVEL